MSEPRMHASLRLAGLMAFVAVLLLIPMFSVGSGAEFSADNQSTERVTAWCAFWGEAPNRPLYLEQSGRNDRAHIEAFEENCKALVAEGGYTLDFRQAARVLRLTIEGVSLELMFSAKPYSQEEAVRTVYFCAATLFPRHFSETGLISR